MSNLVDVVCPPNPDAACKHCGETLGYHLTDDPDSSPTIGDAGCSTDAGDSFWEHRNIRQFVLADGESIDCPEATICDVCQVGMCGKHSNEFVTCAGHGGTIHHPIHHPECVYECAECCGARAEDAATELVDAIRKGEW